MSLTYHPFIALSYSSSYGKTFESFIREAVALGFSGVQLIPDQHPNLWNEFDARRTSELAELLRSLGVRHSVHNVFYDINLVSLVPEIQDFAFAVTSEILFFARSSGATSVTVHAGYQFPGWQQSPQAEVFWVNAKAAVVRLAELSRMIDIPIYLENGSYYVTSAKGVTRKPLHIGIDVNTLGQLIDWSNGGLGISLDIGKAIVSEVDPQSFVERFGGSIGEVQIAPRWLNEGKQAVTTLLKNGYRPNIVIEGGSHSELGGILRGLHPLLNEMEAIRSSKSEEPGSGRGQWKT